MRIIIDHGYEGYVLTVSDTRDPATFPEIYAYGSDNKIKDLQSVLWKVLEELGGTGSRYDKERIRIVVEPGDKYEGS